LAAEEEGASSSAQHLSPLYFSGNRVRIIIALSSHSGRCVRLPELEKAFYSVSTKGEGRIFIFVIFIFFTQVTFA
jgi:hypothetical protein